MQSKYVLFNNTILHYKISGSGSCLMLIHGFGEDWRVWVNQIETLSKNHTLIIPDIFGSGDSEMLQGENITMENYAEGLRAIIRVEKIEQFSIFGHSMGGYIALAYLELFPSDLLSIALIHSTAFADNKNKIEQRDKSIAFIKAFGKSLFLKTSMPKLFPITKNNKFFIESLLQMGNKISENTMIQYHNAIKNRYDKSNLLKNANIPVLFIAGRDDLIVHYLDNIRQCSFSNISEINILNNTAHLGFFESPTISNNLISSFIQNHIDR